MRKFLTKSVGYPLQDLKKKTSILKTRNFLNKSQFWKEEDIRDYQLKKLAQLLKHSYEHVPYYRKLFSKMGLNPNDIKTIDDFKKIPILTRNAARQENLSLISDNVEKNKLSIGETGGTTGPAIKIYKDTNTRSFVWGAFYRWYEWIGVELGDPVVFITGGSSSQRKQPFSKILNKKVKDLLQNTITIDYFGITDKSIPAVLHKISEHKPVLIRSYVTPLLQLAEYLQENNTKIHYPKSISTTAEILLPAHRKIIEDQFNCPVYDQYGCGECESIAFECAEHNGLHVNREHVIVEILNEADEEITNSEGRIIVTDLDNYSMPFIRYENGDASAYSNITCKCGVNQPLLKSINGRIVDNLHLEDGRKIVGGYFTELFSDLDPIISKKIRKFQAYQEKIGQVKFRLESKYTIEKEYLDKIYSKLKMDFSNIEIEVVDKIELESSGKFRYVKSILNENP